MCNIGINAHYVCATKSLKKYECAKCKYSTNFKVHFAKHKNVLCSTNLQHNMCGTQNLEKYYCSVCGHATDLKVYAVKHEHNSEVAETKREPRHRCRNCKFRSDSLFLVIRHEKKGCRNKRLYKKLPLALWWQCRRCPYHSRSHSAATRHAHCRHSPDIFCMCSFCGHQTKSTRGMKYHVVHYHMTRDKKHSYECILCGFKTHLRTRYSNHMATHAKSKNFYCTQCKYVTKISNSLRRHIKTMHCDPEETTWLKCHKCAFETKWPNGLKRHLKNGTCQSDVNSAPGEITWYQCDQCAFRCKFLKYLKRHRTVEHGNANQSANVWFQCGYCCWKGKSVETLETHISSKHPKFEKSHHCEQCSHKAATKYELLKHVVHVHVNKKEPPKKKKERKFVCDKCDYKASSKSNLAKHVTNIHCAPGSVQWFECEQCFFQAKEKGNLAQHIKSMHTPRENIEWKKCEFCDYKAKRRFTVKMHIAKMHCDKI